MNAHPHALHAVYAPSSAHRWTQCTASASAIAMLGEQEEGDAAKKGTAAHEEMERVLGGGAADPDHASAYGVALAAAYIKQLPSGRSWIEERVRLTDQIWGRLDFGHVDDEDIALTILDLKDGFVDVSPVENDQERIYAASLIRQFNLKVKWVRYVICQPNSIVPGPRLKQWMEPAEDLLAWADRVAAIPTSPLHFKAGEHCRYCPLFGRCEPTRDLLGHLATMLQHTPDEVRPDQVAMILATKKPVTDWFAALEKTATRNSLAGNTPSGMKLVTATKHRSWKDEAAARREIVNALGESALELPTPSQAEKLGMAKVEVAALADTPEGGPALAFESDKRKPFVVKTAAQMFAGIPGLTNAPTA